MEKIFSTKERIKILKAIIFTDKPLSVNAVAIQLKISKGLVSKYLDVLAKETITKRSNSKYVINDSAATKAAKILLNIQGIDTAIFKRYDFVDAVGLYGSCARGENTESSDVDIWLKVKDAADDKVASLTVELNKKIKSVKPVFLTVKKTEKIKKEDTLFYHSLVFGSIVLYGDKDAIQL